MVHGEVPYRLLPEIYRSSKVVIDDANHVTKPWGSVNSRVFDALACGTLVLTNGKSVNIILYFVGNSSVLYVLFVFRSTR